MFQKKLTATMASRLLSLAANPKASPFKDEEYAELLRYYCDDPDFSSLVMQCAAGWGLSILYAEADGMVLAVNSIDSPFAQKLGDLKKHFSDEDTASVLLVMLVIGVAFYPRAEDLEGSDAARHSLKTSDLLDLLNQHIEAAAERGLESDDGRDEVDAMLRPGWRKLDIMKRHSVGKRSVNKRSREGLVNMVVDYFKEQNCLVARLTEDGDLLTPTRRFHLQMKDLLGHNIFEWILTNHNTIEGAA